MWGGGAFPAGKGSGNPEPPEGQRKVCCGHLAALLGPQTSPASALSDRAPAEELCAKSRAVGMPLPGPTSPLSQLRPALLPPPEPGSAPQAPSRLSAWAGSLGSQTPGRGPGARGPERCLLCVPGPTMQAGRFQASGSVSLSRFTACPPPRICPASSSVPTSESPPRTPSLLSRHHLLPPRP